MSTVCGRCYHNPHLSVQPRQCLFEKYRETVCSASNITTYLHATVAELETDESAGTVKRARVACRNGKQFWVKARLFILAVGGIESAQLLLLSNQTQQQGLGNAYDLVGRFLSIIRWYMVAYLFLMIRKFSTVPDCMTCGR